MLCSGGGAWHRGGGLPVASAPPLRIGSLGFLGGEKHGGEPRTVCPGPHLLFNVALRDGGPRAIDLAVRPPPGRGNRRRNGRWTDPGRDQFKKTLRRLASVAAVD
jgi:hypothetical protein